MKKKYALFVSIFATLIIAGNFLFFNDVFPEREIVIVERAIDGDTVELEDGRKIRLLNINTPEKNEVGSEEAFNFLKESEGKILELEVEGVDKYGRVLGRLFLKGDYVNLRIVEEGLAHSYIVEENEMEEFKNAEEKARKEGKGIWEKSEYYGCLSAEINKKEEFIIITSECNSNFVEWSLKDESTATYKFEKTEQKTFTLYSGKGKNNEKEIYWGRGKAWNDDKDSIFIRDEEGKLVYYDSYGY